MLYKHIVALSALALCLAEEGKRETRNPGLLHLAHAGQSVGNYVVAGPRVGGGGHGGGGGGPHIVIVGGQPAHVTTHVAGRDSLEELDEDLRQHLGRQQGEQYNSGFQDPVRQQLAYSALKDLKEGRFGTLSPSQDHGGSAGSAGYGGGSTGVGYRIAPVLVNHQPLGHPQQGQAYSSVQISNIASEPVPTHHGVLAGHSGSQYRLSDGGFQHGVTPSSTNYAAPPYYSPTPAPLSHTLATPVIHTVLPARVPLHHPLRPQGFQGVPYHTPLTQGPVFIPVRPVGGHQPQYQSHRFAVGHTPNAEYSPSHFTGRSQERSPEAYNEEYRANAAETPKYYGNVQERRPVIPYQSQIHQRDFDSGESTGYRQGSAEGYKYGSGEVLAKSAGTNSLSFRSKFPSDDKVSQEDVSDEAVSEEQKPGTVNYSFADDHRTEGRSYGGDGKIATSYQSVTLETHDPSPSYYNQKQH